jgi:hypothetical protein
VEERGFNPEINSPIHQQALKGRGFNRAINHSIIFENPSPRRSRAQISRF